ncbi:MAG: hypothetical protein K2M76_02675, partial [Muribaculaceae bacterium]|nr:hypothetical protein [Muribaculaceae bacterium]
MNDKLITLYEQLEQLSSDLQVMMTRVSDMQQALALLTKEWLERTAPDVIEETIAVPVYEAEPEQNSEMAECVDTHDDIADPCIAVASEEAMPDSADEILTEDTGDAEAVEDIDDQVDVMVADVPVEFEDDIEIVEMDDDM